METGANNRPTAPEASSGAWDDYFNEPAAPDGGVNWEAYSHEELYQMLYQDADVADVSTVAAEWAEHREALTTHADVLREQKVALLESWTGSGAEEAARRLDQLANRVEKIAELAAAGERAAQESADALATARAMMPPPPEAPAVPEGGDGTGAAPAPGTAAGAPAKAGASALSSVPGFSDWSAMMPPAPPAPPAPPTAPTPPPPPAPPPSPAPTSDTGTAFGAVGGAQFSFYVGANTADMQKAQAVRAMQGYESSLSNSSHLIGEARSTIPAASMSGSGGEASGTAPSSAGGESWDKLVGSGSGASSGASKGLAAGAVAGAVVGGVAGVGAGAGVGPGGGHAAALGAGARVGAAAGMANAANLHGSALAAESAAARGGMAGGMVPPGGARGAGESEEQHENQLPTIDHELFPSEEPGSEVVIGLEPEVGS